MVPVLHAHATPGMIVLSARRHPGFTLVVRRVEFGPRKVVRFRMRRRHAFAVFETGRVIIYRGRLCHRRCGHWSRTVRVTTIAPAPPSPVPPEDLEATPPLGFADSSDAWNHPDEFWSDLHALHAREARRIVLWPLLEPGPFEQDFNSVPWRQFDAFMHRARDEGLPVVLEVAGVPTWARQHPLGSDLGGAPFVGAWHDFTMLLAERYAGQVEAFGWNESDCCTRDSYIPTSDQVAMLRSVYPELHAAGVEVMGNAGCPCGWPTVGATQFQTIRALGRAQAAGKLLDSISIHVYPSYAGRKLGFDPVGAGSVSSFVTNDFKRLVQVIDEYVPGRVSFRVTETGWMTPGGYHGDALDGDAQRDAILRELANIRLVGKRCLGVDWFLVRDQPTAGTYMTGVRYAGGAPKPVYAALEAYR